MSYVLFKSLQVEEFSTPRDKQVLVTDDRESCSTLVLLS